MNDKLMHFIAGVAISAVFLPFGGWAADIAAFTIGLLKEVWDKYNNGTVETLDFLVTGAGGVSLVSWWFLVVPL